MEEILRGVLQRHKDCGFKDIGIDYLTAILDEFSEKAIPYETCNTITKTEAINLEALCEKYIGDELKTDITISLALTGRLKVEFGENYITFNKDNFSPDWIKYSGSFDGLKCDIALVQNRLMKHSDEFKKLIWSYENRQDLTD